MGLSIVICVNQCATSSAQIIQRIFTDTSGKVDARKLLVLAYTDQFYLDALDSVKNPAQMKKLVTRQIQIEGVRNRDIPIDALITHFTDPNNLAYCLEDYIRIRLDEFNKYPDIYLREVVYHEFGHCIFDLEHKSDPCTNDIMCANIPYISSDDWFYRQLVPRFWRDVNAAN